MAARELHWWRHRRAHASAIERVPLIAAGSRPAVVIAGRPAAEWAADAGARRATVSSCSTSRSKTTEDLAGVIESPTVLRDEAVLSLSKFHCFGAFFVVVCHVVDPRAHWIAPHLAGIIRLQQF